MLFFFAKPENEVSKIMRKNYVLFLKAVLILFGVGLLAFAVFLLPKPLKWYAVQAAEALRAFADTLLAPPSGGRKGDEENSSPSGEDKA